MTVTLRGTVMVAAPLERTWSALVDWKGQEDWIPMTTTEVLSERRSGIGTRIRAFSGLRLGPLPLGLIDNFIVTDWQPPTVVEVLHLGPYFTGLGLFELAYRGAGRTWVSVLEAFELPFAAVTEVGARLALPVMRLGLQASLRTFARTVEADGA